MSSQSQLAGSLGLDRQEEHGEKQGTNDAGITDVKTQKNLSTEPNNIIAPNLLKGSANDQSKPSSKPSMKDMTKAERRAIQEKQRADKAALKASSGTPAQKPSTKSTAQAKPSTSNPPRIRSDSASIATPETSIPLPHSLQIFLHLQPPSINNLSVSQRTNPVVHDSILRLAQLYAEFKIVGSNARCMAMLEAFKHVIHSYSPPAGTSLSRHLHSHLSPQISYLIQARPLSVSMGNAIRHLKSIISRIGVDLPDEEAKQYLYDRIDLFIQDRIILADKVIQSHAITKIKDGDVIMTYANSSVIQGVLLEAHRQGIRFQVVLVDSRPTYEAKNLLKLLTTVGIDCTYILLTAIGTVLRKVNLVLLGAHAMLGNGALYGRAGTGMIAMISKSHGIPVVCCCETYKFSERVMLDSIVSNEIGTSESTIPPASYHHLFKFPSSVALPTQNPENEVQELSLLYDVTRPEDVTMVITEAGIIPVQSVPVLLRDYKPLISGS